MTNAEKALQLHKEWNGKLDVTPKCQVKSREDLAIAYTPGVAEPCKVIAENKEAAYQYTIKSNTVAVVSDGSAVLGLGNIGPEAAMPDHQNRDQHCTGFWRYQLRRYFCATLL